MVSYRFIIGNNHILLRCNVSIRLYRFTARASAAALVHIVYPRLTEKLQVEAFNIYIRLSKDETPMVRRIAAQNLENWTAFAKSASMYKELLSIFKSFVLDDQVVNNPLHNIVFIIIIYFTVLIFKGFYSYPSCDDKYCLIYYCIA